MSIWTHITGCIRIDDYKMIIQPNNKTDFSEIFIRNTWYHPNGKCNLPTGSEGSIDVEFIDRNDDDSSNYMRTVAFFGDLRGFGKEDCKKVVDWWFNIPEKLGKSCGVRQAVLQISPEDGQTIVLTEKDMNIIDGEQ